MINIKNTILLLLLSYSYVLARSTVVFRMDDFGIDNEYIYPKIIQVFQENGVRITLGVVPFKSNMKKCNGLSESQKEILINGIRNNIIDIAQHGYEHNNIGNIKNSEFVGLTFIKQYKMISAGKEYLEKELNIKIECFIPPWNSYDNNTMKVLDTLKYKCISAACKGNISSISEKINYLPYTITIIEYYKIYNKLIEKNQKDDCIVVLIHAPDIKIGKGGVKKEEGITLFELDRMIKRLKSSGCIIEDIRSATTQNKYTRKRFINNTMYNSLVPVYKIFKMENYRYLTENELNIRKYIDIVYNMLFYPTIILLVISCMIIVSNRISIFFLLIYKTKVTWVISVILLYAYIIITYHHITPTYLTLLSILLGILSYRIRLNIS